MEWWSASDTATSGAWRPPMSDAESAAASPSPASSGAGLPAFIPSESDLNVLIEAVDSASAFHYDSRAPSLLTSLATPTQCFEVPAVASSLQVPTLYWGSAEFTAMGLRQQSDMHTEQTRLPSTRQQPSESAFLPTAMSASVAAFRATLEAPMAQPKSLATPKRRTARQCCVPDCPRSVRGKGRCARHGGGKTGPVELCSPRPHTKRASKQHCRCAVERCENVAQSGGRCRTHGVTMLCTFPGCTVETRRTGRCVEHQGVRVCSANGCAQPSQHRGSFCSSHRRP